jgi:hypothetical protein
MIFIDSIFVAILFAIIGSLCLWLALGGRSRNRLTSKPVAGTAAPTITKRSLRRQQLAEWNAEYAKALREHTDYFVGEIKTLSDLVHMLEANRRDSAYNNAMAKAEKQAIDRFTGQDRDRVRSIQPNTRRHP